jgi:hypothetical protein
MTRFTKHLTRNQLYALSALPPTIFLFTGHVVLGLLFLGCVVGGRFSRPRSSTVAQEAAGPK